MASHFPVKDAGDNPSELIAKLSSLLEQAVTTPGELHGPNHSSLSSNPPSYTLSDNLLSALLAVSSRTLPIPGQLLSFVGQYRDRIAKSLETNSLQCLAAYLLRLSTNDCIGQGLRFLMDEPVYTCSVLRTQLKVPTSEAILSLIYMKLITEVYQIFADETGPASARRMAGKVLAELVHDSSEHCHLLGEIDGHNGLRPVIAALISILDDPDIVLAFFANTILRAIYHSGISDSPNQQSTGLLSDINRRVETQGDGIEQFCSFVRAKRQRSTKHRGRIQDGGTDGAIPPCYIVDFNGAHANMPPKGHVAMIIGAGRLDLIHCSNDTSSWRVEYIAIRLTGPTQTTCTFSGASGKDTGLVSLHIQAKDSVTVNDQEQDVETVNLGIAHGDDLTRIVEKLEAAGIRCRATDTRNSLNRPRSSSVLIPLDAYEETIPSSSQKTAISYQKKGTPASPHVRWTNESTNIAEDLELIPETSSEGNPQSSLTELTRTPTVHKMLSPHSASPISSAKNQATNTTTNAPGSTTQNKKRVQTKQLPRSSARNATRSSSQGVEAPSEDGPARNTRSSTSSRKPIHKSNVLKPIPSNTQESLIFPRRRSRGKLYTVPTKTIVDWDEDLRASDGSVEPQSKKDGELTSISSPSSDCAPLVFEQRSKMRPQGSTRKRSARKKPASKSRKRPGPGRKAKVKKQANGKAKPASPLPKNYTSRLSRQLTDVSGKNLEHSESSQPIPGHCPPETSKPANDSSQDRSRIPTSSDGQVLAENNQGRGQAVAEKLIAALRGSRTPENRHDKAHEYQHRDMGYEVELVHESPPMPAELVHDRPQAEDQERRDNVQDMQDMQDVLRSSSLKISQREMTGDKIYSEAFLGTSTCKQTQAIADQEGFLREGEIEFRVEREPGTKKARKTSSLTTTSSVEPRSTDSTPEAYYTSPSPNKGSRALVSDFQKPTSTGNAFNFGSGETLWKEYGQSNGSSSGAPYRTDHFTEGIVFREYNSWIRRDDNGASRTAVDQEDCAVDDGCLSADALGPGSNTIVDKNGSPRLKQQAGSKSIEHAVPKRRGASPTVEPPNPKRMKAMHEENRNHANDVVGNMGNSQGPGRLGSDGSFRKYTLGSSPSAGGQPDTHLSASHKTSDSERRSSFQYRVRRPLLTSGSKAPGSDSEQEQSRPHETIQHSSNKQTSATGKSSLDRAEPRRKISFELPRIPCQTDWQTSFQELHEGMERTLLSNSEHLSRQIDRERSTVNRVLNGYRDQCHIVLDQLFQTQLERIRLCKQQMDTVRQQHADVCQGLIRSLEENEKSLEAFGDA